MYVCMLELPLVLYDECQFKKEFIMSSSIKTNYTENFLRFKLIREIEWRMKSLTLTPVREEDQIQHWFEFKSFVDLSTIIIAK